MRRFARHLILTFAVWSFVASAAAQPAATSAPQLWLYAPCNFQVNEQADRLIALLDRARAAGYTTALITDYKFGNLDDRPDHYFTNLQRVKDHAQRIGVRIVPAVMPIGYSNEILQNDPHLAEGIPVVNAAMKVQGNHATIADTANLLPGGNFEQPDRNRPAGWDWVDGFNISAHLDNSIKHSGDHSLRLDNFRASNPDGNCRVMLRVAVEPNTQYHLSVWIRTDSVEPASDIRAAVLDADGQPLDFTNLRVQSTQDWTEHHVVFNSLEGDSAGIYLGIWGGRSGTIWLDDASLSQVAGVNLLRRPGCPIRVTNADGSITFEEGRDFERWEHAEMGRVPWPGEYQVYHAQPPIHLTRDSRIPDAATLLVSYYHTSLIYDGQVSACLSEPDLYRHLTHQTDSIQRLLSPAGFMMSHDELRLANQCHLCRSRNLTAGELLADNARRCVEIIRAASPAAPIHVWSDMFDPHHNAVDHYYLVRGSLAGSWQGLDPSVTIMNWNHDKRRDSLACFAERGHKQVIAGYYDNADVEAEVTRWRQAAAGLTGVDGYMYTTWQGDYANLERFAAAVLDGHKEPAR